MLSGVYGSVRLAVLREEVVVVLRTLDGAEDVLPGRRSEEPTHSRRGSTPGLADCRALSDTPYFAAMPDSVSPGRTVTEEGILAEVFDTEDVDVLALAEVDFAEAPFASMTNGAAPQPDESCRGDVGWAGSGRRDDGCRAGDRVVTVA